MPASSRRTTSPSASRIDGARRRVFDVIAGAVERAVRGESGPLPLGLVYSFPARLERIDRAVALPLTKGWRTVGLEGHDVAGLLRVALGRRGLARIVLAAVANDTVAALMLQSYRIRGRAAAAPPAEVGLILGTGTNQAADLPGAVSGISSRAISMASRRWRRRGIEPSIAS